MVRSEEPIVTATIDYEHWLKKHVAVVETDLQLKHKEMAASLFAFMRATFYRWVSLWPEVCADLTKTPRVLGVGDLHVENFGTWRDAEGRLVWGVNDFDEVARMPYAVDLTRLVTSAVLAKRENGLAIDPGEAATAVLEGYSEYLEEGGKPFILEEARVRRGGPVALRRPERLSDRRARRSVHLHLLYAEATRRGSVLSDGHRRQNGAAFDGSKTYRLAVPPNAPVRQYWSATIYDRSTHALIREMSHAGRSSQTPGLQVNADGSVDLYFGPTAPAGK